MRVWTMHDFGGLMENLDGVMYAMQVSLDGRERGRMRAGIKAMRTILGCMEECLGDGDGRIKDKEDRER